MVKKSRIFCGNAPTMQQKIKINEKNDTFRAKFMSSNSRGKDIMPLECFHAK